MEKLSCPWGNSDEASDMETKWSLVIVILFSPGRVFLCAFLVRATFPSFYRSWIYTGNGTSLSLSSHPLFFISPWIASEKIVERFRYEARINREKEFPPEILISKIACQVSRHFVNFQISHWKMGRRKERKEKQRFWINSMNSLHFWLLSITCQK